MGCFNLKSPTYVGRNKTIFYTDFLFSSISTSSHQELIHRLYLYFSIQFYLILVVHVNSSGSLSNGWHTSLILRIICMCYLVSVSILMKKVLTSLKYKLQFLFKTLIRAPKYNKDSHMTWPCLFIIPIQVKPIPAS